MATVLPSETPQYAFADLVNFNTRLKKKEIPPHSVIVAGKNFGCGSSREQAASCLKGPDFIVIARDFARIFLQNSINLGLNTIICPGYRGRGRGRTEDLCHTGNESDKREKLRDRAPAPSPPGNHRCRRIDPIYPAAVNANEEIIVYI